MQRYLQRSSCRDPLGQPGRCGIGREADAGVRRARGLAIALFVLLSLPLGASAQDTGGSFGGSDFGGGGGSTGGGSSSSSSGGGGGGGSDFDDGDDGGRHGGNRSSTFEFVLIALGVGAFVVNQLLEPKLPLFPRTPPQVFPPSSERGDVSSIRIALDHNARPAMQAKLDALARRGASRTSTSRAAALHEVCSMLRRHQTSWLFADVESSPLTSIPEVQAKYERVVADARTRFRIETVRSADGVLVESPDTTVRDRGEGPGLVVVTVVVAARRELTDVTNVTDARALKGLLRTFGTLQAAELMGLEVIWSPSAEDDRMTVEELRRVYPELLLIRDDTIADRLFCGYCSSPFSKRLKRCPHCGASAADGRRPEAPAGR